MAEAAPTTINANDKTADFTIAEPDPLNPGSYLTAESYKGVLTRFDFDAAQEMIDVTTFNDEGKVKNDPGRLVIGFSIAGLLTKGVTVSGPLIPPPQDVKIIATFSTGCTITLDAADFTRATVTRIVNTNGLITGSGVADGSITMTWVTS